MITPLRIAAENIIALKEKTDEKISEFRKIFTLKVPILMYHHICSKIPPDDNPKLYVNERLFEEEMAYLKDKGYKTITLDDLTEHLRKKKKLLDKSIILTFDDGNLDFYTKAFPILKRYKLKATVFVITSMLNKPKYLTTAMLQKMKKSSIITIGSHTINHPDLTQLSTQKVFYELNESKKYLENIVTTVINSFAYPYGKYNEKIPEEIKKAGYLTAVSTKYGYLHNGTNFYQLKRIRHGNKLTIKNFIRRVVI